MARGQTYPRPAIDRVEAIDQLDETLPHARWTYRRLRSGCNLGVGICLSAPTHAVGRRSSKLGCDPGIEHAASPAATDVGSVGGARRTGTAIGRNSTNAERAAGSRQG